MANGNTTAQTPPHAPAPALDAGSWAMLLLLALIWGGSFLFGRVAVLELPPLAVVFFRVSLAAVAIWAWLLARRGWPAITPRFLRDVGGMAIVNNILPFSLILYGQQEIGSGLAAIVNAMTPIWTVIIANFLTTDEKLSSRKLVGIFAGFAGVAILMGGDIVNGLSGSVLAQLAVLCATLSYGFASVYGKRFRNDDPILVASGQLSASTLIMAVIMVATGTLSDLAMPSPAAIGSVVGLALPCTAFAYVLFFSILKRAGATSVSLVTFLVPVSAILLGMLFLGEVLTGWHMAGMALIALGLIILDGRLIRIIR
ncbi:MAG: DMT family transporter [Nitratireductor sp.]|nr:DMT family transporter [Nitratireductor sp.]